MMITPEDAIRSASPTHPSFRTQTARFLLVTWDRPSYEGNPDSVVVRCYSVLSYFPFHVGVTLKVHSLLFRFVLKIFYGSVVVENAHLVPEDGMPWYVCYTSSLRD
jgi:hypothetical protein